MRRKFSANYIYTGTGKLLKYGIIELDEAGTITKLIDTGGQMAELANLEFYSGIIVPGFVNAHCHLELSHMLGKVPKHTGLADFVRHISQRRKPANDSSLRKAMQAADAQMYHSGIVAVGDISNRTDSIEIKKASKIKYHTFVEAFGLNPDKATEIFDTAWHTKLEFLEKDLSASLSPHAPYSMSSKLMQSIIEYAEKNHKPVTIHNQETASENELFETGTGALYETFKAANLPVDEIQQTGKSSLHSIFPTLNRTGKLLLVHNTFSAKADIELAVTKHNDPYWVMCPNANLYIEKQLPNIEMFRQAGATICLGTDSLASNEQLSIIEELITIHEYFPEIPFGELLQWATINGAKALGLESHYGTIEPGKTPGLVLIQGFDYAKMQLSGASFARRIA